MLSVNTNVASLDAQKNLAKTQTMLEKAISHLSSGLRITTASDDAAGLATSMQLQARIASYNQAARNATDAISNVQTTEGYLNEVGNILTRLRELTMGNQGTGTEATQLTGELDRINSTAAFSGTAQTYQVGVGNTAGTDTIDFVTSSSGAAWDVSSSGLGLAGITLSKIDTAITKVANFRSYLGAMGNRFQSALNTIQTASQNASATNSRIQDVDVASETSNLSRAQILAQSGIAVLAQANQLPQMALKLLG